MRTAAVLTRLENTLAAVAMLAMVALPILEILARRLFGIGIPGSGPIVQHLTLWVGFLGAAIAARDGKLLALATGTMIPHPFARRLAGILAAAIAAWTSVILAWGGVQMVAAEREAQTMIGAGIPTWTAQIVLPAAFVIIRVPPRVPRRTCMDRQSPGGVGVVAAFVMMRSPALVEGVAIWPGLVLIVDRCRPGHAVVRRPWRRGRLAVPAGRRHARVDPRRDLFPERLPDAAGDSALHLRRIPARRRAGVGTAVARIPRIRRRHPRGDGGCLRGPLFVLHRFHRRIRRHDSGARGRVVSRA